MNKLDEIVLQYLKMKTNYAIVISGEWGGGKTYYYESNLKKLIRETPLITDNKKKYTPILISLFGLNSIPNSPVDSSCKSSRCSPLLNPI